MSGNQIGPKGTSYTTGFTHGSETSNKENNNTTESKIPRSDDRQSLSGTSILNRKTEKSEDQSLSDDQLGMLIQLHKTKNSKVFKETLITNVATMGQLKQLRQSLPNKLDSSFEAPFLQQAASLTMTDVADTLMMELDLPSREYFNVLAGYMGAPNQVHCPVRTIMTFRAEEFVADLGAENADLNALVDDMTIRTLSLINSEMRTVAENIQGSTSLSHEDQLALKQQLQQQHNVLTDAIEARS